MIATTEDLVQHFGAVTGFTQSDEITLVFAPVDGAEPLMFGGRVMKMVSLFAGYCSARFNFHVSKIARNAERGDQSAEDACLDNASNASAYFDARLFNLPTPEAALENVLWRSHFDCRRNSISMLAQAHFSAKSLHGLNQEQLLAKLNEKGVDWHCTPTFFRFGTVCKKDWFFIEGLNPMTQQRVTAVRSRMASRSFDLSNGALQVSTLFWKFWEGDQPPDVTPDVPA